MNLNILSFQVVNACIKNTIKIGALLLVSVVHGSSGLAVNSLLAVNFKTIYFFGDSLSDAGALGKVFTTLQGPVWSQYVADYLHTPSQSAFNILQPGGHNYAVAGENLNETTRRFYNFFKIVGGKLDSDTLYVLWGGVIISCNH